MLKKLLETQPQPPVFVKVDFMSTDVAIVLNIIDVGIYTWNFQRI